MPRLKTPLEIYKLLPKTNCGQCYVPTCLAFAAAVIKGDKQFSDCPHLQGTSDEITEKIDTRAPLEATREEHLASLKSQLPAVDFSLATQRLGAHLAGDKLAIKSLGKDFFVNQQGSVSSECHTHAGLTIPLLSYIIHSKGGNVSGDWVPFRELKNGGPMNPLFVQRAEKPLKQIADTHTDLFEDLISIFSGIEIERPVSRPPSHRSLRAVFPHRAPQYCSLRTSAKGFYQYPIIRGIGTLK